MGGEQGDGDNTCTSSGFGSGNDQNEQFDRYALAMTTRLVRPGGFDSWLELAPQRKRSLPKETQKHRI